MINFPAPGALRTVARAQGSSSRALPHLHLAGSPRPAAVTPPPAAADAALAEPVDDRAALLDKIDHLNRAIVSNREIGAAIGILMVRQQLTYQQAFECLRRASQDSNQKMREIAAQVVLQGLLPNVPGAWQG